MWSARSALACWSASGPSRRTHVRVPRPTGNARTAHPPDVVVSRRDPDLLRQTAGLALREIAEQLGLSLSAIEGPLRRHELRMTDVVGYEESVTRALRSAVRMAFPAPGRGTHLALRLGLSQDGTLEVPRS